MSYYKDTLLSHSDIIRMRKTHRRIHSALDNHTTFPGPTRDSLPRIPRGSRKQSRDTHYIPIPLPQAFARSLRDSESLSEISGGLERHRVTDSMRGNLVNWMLEILATFRSSPQTLFLTCKIMDKYFCRSLKCIQPSQLHLVGIVSMFMASKFEDVMPLTLFDIRDTIAFRKFSEDTILQTEQNILRALDFNLHIPTAIDFLMHYHTQLGTSYPVQACSEVLLVISLHIYSFQTVRDSLLSAGCIYFSTHCNAGVLEQLVKLSGYAAVKIMEVASRLEKEVQNLKVRYPYIKNTFVYMKCKLNPHSSLPLIFELSETQQELERLFKV